MKINKQLVDETMDIVQKKISAWNRYFPALKFDELGRAVIGGIEGIPSNDMWRLDSCSRTFTMAFNQYLIDKEYLLKDSSGVYHSTFRTYFVDMNRFAQGYFHFRNKHEKAIQIKASRVLAGVQEHWSKIVPQYKEYCDKIKELRAIGETYETSHELRQLSYVKDDLEIGNWYFAYQKLSNQYVDGQKLCLTINPLDLLTSSGGGSGNPTSFSTCWSTYIDTYDDFIDVYNDGCYSDPVGIYNLGCIMNRGMVYISNGREVDIPHTNMKLHGYVERVHVWFDDGGLWYERPYPSRLNSALDKYIEAFNKFGVGRVDIGSDEYEEFTYQDRDGIRNFINDNCNIFLDRVAVGDDYNLFKMKCDRVNYSYDDGIHLPEWHNCECCGDNGADNYLDGIGYVCNSCMSNFSQCSDCGHWIYNDDSYRVIHHGYGTQYVCESCRDDNYTYCDHCGEYTNESIYDTLEGATVCEDCIDDYNYCNGYDQYTNEDTYEVGNNYYCESYLDEHGYVECQECGRYTQNDSEYCDYCEENMEDKDDDCDDIEYDEVV